MTTTINQGQPSGAAVISDAVASDASETVTKRTARKTRRLRPSRESVGWEFMRVSGAFLIALVAFHLITNVLMGAGVRQINFAFVAGKWASPFSQIATFLLLVLTVTHGANGVRSVIQDYVRNSSVSRILLFALYALAAALLLLGGLVLFTLDPCPPAAPAYLLPDFCFS
ncbi:MAG: succinate dehydrogenase [Cellulomonadaceae bacterium]|jgi:succinate dehydrogenase / fumarate reductase membrane anchor subunit|nr:succinate dehydrogenase [Cellulomonadaceae bacterium]